MLRAVRLLLFCAALGGCSATSGGITSLTSIGGSSSADMPSKAPVPPASSSQNSGNGGIWANFSSAFSPGDHPVQAPQKNSDEVMSGLYLAEALRLVNEYRSSKGLPALSLDSHATAAAEILAKDMAAHDHMSHAGPNGADLHRG